MPRTKINKKVIKQAEEAEIIREVLLKHITSIKEELRDQIKAILYKTVEQNHAELLAQFPQDMLNIQSGDLKKMSSLNSQSLSTMNINVTLKHDLLNSTKGVKKMGKRSSSADDGYLTTESLRSNHRSREKSQKIRENKSSKSSRSLSRCNGVSTDLNFMTPDHQKISLNSYGTITPKCKPNTPHVLLRRPKAGEVALSFQGSPLLTAPVVTDRAANINIPLNDGTLLSLQPQEGLRLSQIPTFDDTTLKQLETLNRHIEMVLGAQAQL